MTDLDILRQMIKDSARVEMAVHRDRKMVELTEPQHPDSSARLFGIPEDAVVIKVDAFKSPDTIFKGSQGECKRADFIIVAEVEETQVVVYIEMKTTKEREHEIAHQLAGAQCFLAYCREIGNTFWRQPAFLADRVERFVSIGHTNINKTKTRITRQPATHDRPERMLKIASPHHLEFRHLAGVNR